jgi:outer membrane protein OmpA-like peptidoglycan-associated protein
MKKSIARSGRKGRILTSRFDRTFSAGRDLPGSLRTRCCITLLILLCAAAVLQGEDRDEAARRFINYAPGGRFTVTEKYNLRKRIDGIYKGFVYREIRGILSRDSAPGSYSGSFFLYQETTRNLINTAAPIDSEIPVRLTLSDEGFLLDKDFPPYPSYRNMPAFPEKMPLPGDSWEAPAELVIFPEQNAPRIPVPLIVKYRYTGMDEYNGEPVHALEAEFALRYRAEQDASSPLRAASGTHAAVILVGAEDGRLVLIRDTVSESYRMADGRQIAYEGFVLIWNNAVTALEKEEIEDDIVTRLEEEKIDDVSVSRTGRGVELEVRDLHFLPDKAVLLPEEHERIAAIAAALKKIEGRSFLVVGHTADIGSAESQRKLSLMRAKAVVDLLSGHGIAADRFMYQGKGGSEPIAPNDTEEHMAKNRRVEIIILED